MKNIFKYLLCIPIMYICSCQAQKTDKNSGDEDYNINYGKYIKETGKPQKFDKDLVPDEKTAIKLADIIWDAKYGSPKGIRDLPYTVFLEEEKVWYIKTNLPKGYFGQVLHIKINKYDGKILYIWSEG